VADAVWEARDDVLEEPEVWGVEKLTANAVVIRLVVKTLPSDQYDASRELRQRLKEEFDREGIEIPFPQQMVWNRNVDDRDALPSPPNRPPSESGDGTAPAERSEDGPAWSTGDAAPPKRPAEPAPPTSPPGKS